MHQPSTTLSVLWLFLQCSAWRRVPELAMVLHPVPKTPCFPLWREEHQPAGNREEADGVSSEMAAPGVKETWTRKAHGGSMWPPRAPGVMCDFCHIYVLICSKTCLPEKPPHTVRGRDVLALARRALPSGPAGPCASTEQGGR